MTILHLIAACPPSIILFGPDLQRELLWLPARGSLGSFALKSGQYFQKSAAQSWYPSRIRVLPIQQFAGSSPSGRTCAAAKF